MSCRLCSELGFQWCIVTEEVQRATWLYSTLVPILALWHAHGIQMLHAMYARTVVHCITCIAGSPFLCLAFCQPLQLCRLSIDWSCGQRLLTGYSAWQNLLACWMSHCANNSVSPVCLQEEVGAASTCLLRIILSHACVCCVLHGTSVILYLQGGLAALGWAAWGRSVGSP